MTREIEVASVDAGGTAYRFKGGRATVYVHEKSAVDLMPDSLERQLDAAERNLDMAEATKARLAQNHRANADAGERLHTHGVAQCDGSGLADLTVEATSGSIVLRRDGRTFVVFDHELPAVYEAARRRWADSFEKKKLDLLAEVRRTGEAHERAKDALRKLKEEDGGLHLVRGDS